MPSLCDIPELLEVWKRLAKSLISKSYYRKKSHLQIAKKYVPHEKEIVEEFSRKVGVPVIEHIPRSLRVQEAEALGKTVLEAFPESDQSEVYRGLAKKVLENKYIHIPSPLSGMDEIMDTVKMYIKK